ncbi:Phage tail protein [Pseudomonas sp. IT-P100]|uniref:hypothetical protein n=1 Tax=Pseudomonas sp. IT-P100 TaxID=3026452 RepID=UPI0039E1E85D
MTAHYITTEGIYVGGFGDGATPDDVGLINLGDNPPEYADQVWLFPGWTASPSQLRRAEDVWRDSELPIAKDNVTAIQFEDPDALPGTEAEWKAYWIALRNWKEGNPDYPDLTKRPIRPS